MDPSIVLKAPDAERRRIRIPRNRLEYSGKPSETIRIYREINGKPLASYGFFLIDVIESS